MGQNLELEAMRNTRSRSINKAKCSSYILIEVLFYSGEELKNDSAEELKYQSHLPSILWLESTDKIKIF